MDIQPATVADAAGIARVHVDSWRDTYVGIVPDDYLAKLSYADRELRWRSILSSATPSACAFVAVDAAGAIVGFADGGPRRDGPERFAGELYAIYLARAIRRQGLGRRLVAAVAGALARAGMRAMLVWVFAENPSRRFYKALGGQFLGEQTFELGGAAMVEVAYGWEDVTPLLQTEGGDGSRSA